MNKTAYLVGEFGVENGVPIYRGASIFSEKNPTTRFPVYQWVIMEANGYGYEDAIRNLFDEAYRQRYNTGAWHMISQELKDKEGYGR